MMKVVISQPMYLPWPGIFDQIKNSDIFIHYNDVQLPQGRSFCSRVQLKKEKKVCWLTVPLINKSRGKIMDVEIDHSTNWYEQHLDYIERSLSKYPYYKDSLNLITERKLDEFTYLSDLCVYLIQSISNYLGFKKKFFQSSDWPNDYKGSEKLLYLCKKVKTTEYLTGHGAKNYINHQLFENNNIIIKYMDYAITPYLNEEPFNPFVTILELIAIKGKSSADYLNSDLVYWRDFLK